MNQIFTPLPSVLLSHLGACSRLDALAALPQVNLPVLDLRQQKSDETYHVNLDDQGLTLTLQCINPNAQPEELTWGLHGLTLDAAAWDGGWPNGLNPQEATADDVVALFAPNPEEVANMHPMLCFVVEGMAGQTWSVMAMFDTAGRKLSSFSLIRVGPWRELQPATA